MGDWKMEELVKVRQENARLRDQRKRLVDTLGFTLLHVGWQSSLRKIAEKLIQECGGGDG